MHTTRMLFVFPVLLGLALLWPLPAGAAWPTDPAVNLPVCAASGDQYFPRAVSDQAGGAIIVWMDRRGGFDPQLYAQRVGASGMPQWTAGGAALTASSGNQKYESIAADGFGGAVVAWTDGGAIHAQRINASAVRLWGAEGVVVESSVGEPIHAFPHIVSDGSGGAIIAFVVRDGRCGQTDIYARHVSGAGTVLTPNRVPVSTAPGDQQELDITPDGAGGAYVSWVENLGNNPDGHGFVYVQRLNASCVPQWSTNGVAVSADNCESGGLTAGAIGGAIVAWTDYRSGTANIYARAISGSGIPQWIGGGVALCTAPGGADTPQVISDGAGGAIVTWWDSRSGTHVDTYAQRVSALGAPLWTTDGVALCTASGMTMTDAGILLDVSFAPPFVAPDGAGGVIATWFANRGGSGIDIYSERVNSAGLTLWLVNGVALSTAYGHQVMSTLTADGAGGAIVVWEDHRNLDWDIHAQRVEANGQLGGNVASVTGDSSPAFALDSVRPNPTRGGALTVHFTLAGSSAASLELFDVAGRRVASRNVSSLGAGQHTVDLALDQRVAPGNYAVRLTQGSSERVMRVVLLK